MTARTERNRQIINRYTGQPDTLPPEIRREIESAWGNGPVQLYALADLDPALRLRTDWVALGPDQLALRRENGSGETIDLRLIDISRIREVKESPGLTCTKVTLITAPDEPALAEFRYSQRQRRAMGALLYVLRQRVEGKTPEHEAADAVYAEGIAQPIREAQASVASNRAAIVWRLLGYLRPYRKQVVIGMLAASAMTLVGLVPPYLTGYIIDNVIRPFQDGSLSQSDAARMALVTIAGLAAVFITRETMTWIRLRKMAVLGEHVARDLRNDLYEHLHKLSVSYFSSKQTGSIISRVSSDTDRIWDFIAFGVVEVSLSLLMLIGLGGVLIFLDWQLGLLMALPVPLMLYLIYRNGRGMQRMFLRAWRKWSNLTDVLSDTIPGIRVVKAFNQSTYEKGRFGERNRTVTDEFFRIHHHWTAFWPFLLLLVHAMTVAVWFFALPRILGDEPTLTAGTFVSFLLYLGMFFQPIEVFGQMSRMINRSVSSAHRIFEVLDTEPDLTDQPEPVPLEEIRGEVTFENVSFAYDPVRPVLKGISFDVRPGEMIGLVGPSGSGKTTIINLVARFYDPTGGRITIDGHDLREVDSGRYRERIGMVLQDPYLFHGSILDNIRYGLHGASIDQVVAAARAANAHDFICKLAHGYDTIVGERGHTLSGGERQRISIARAILHNPRILILDEATSSVDTETERKIQEALDRLVAGRTVFAIAHRLSTLTRASRLFVIKDGQLVEQGTHEALLANPDGVYRKLHDMQRELHEMYAV